MFAPAATPQGVCSPVAKANARKRIANHRANARSTQGRIAGWQKSYEYSRVACLWTFMLHIVGKRLTGFRRKGQHIHAQRFGVFERNGASLPVNVCELQIGYFTAAQAQIQRTANNCVATQRRRYR